MAGVTPEGFVAKTIEEIKGELEADQLETLDPTLVLSPDQPFGQINAAHSKKLAELWEIAQVCYNAFDRDAAEDRLLDNVGGMTGTPRAKARKSLVACTVNLGAAFSQPAGALMANVLGQPTIQFVNRDAIVSTTAGDYTAYFECIVTGPVAVNAGTLTQKTNSVTGWNSITNPTDAIPGALVEEDPDYRQRQVDELTAPGASTTDAIRTDLLELSGVLQAFVFENVTLVTNSDGLHGKAIECVVYDGPVPAASDTAIAQAIWNSKPSGAETQGTSSALAIDKLGVARTVYFSRAVIQSIYLELDIKVDASRFPVGGTTLVKTTAVKEGNALNLGDDVIALDLRAAPLERLGGVPGVTDVIAIRLGFSPSPVGIVNLDITGRQIARFDTSRVVVNIV